MAYQQSGPTFALCGTFSGTTIAASRWLIKFNHEMKGYRSSDGNIPPDLYLESLNMLLTDDAADWAESHPEAVRMLSDPNPTADTVERFKSLFCDRFPSKIVELTPVSFDVELAELNQRSDEPLLTYYKRVTNIMQRVGAKDRSASPSSAPLTILESAMLDTILRAFIRGLNNQDISREATRGMASAERSLRNIYTLADEARRTQEEIDRLQLEQSKTKEIEMLKSLLEKTMSKAQLEGLISSYRANASSRPVDHSTDSIVNLLNRLRVDGDSKHEHSQSSNRSESCQNPKCQHEHESSSRPYPYRPQQPMAITQNPNNPPTVNRYQNNNPQRPADNRPNQREIPDRRRSKNPFINGSRVYSREVDGLLCVRCGKLGFKSGDGHDCPPMPAWEQSYARELVFGSSPQSNFAAAGFGANDGAAKPWEWPTEQEPQSSSTNSPQVVTPATSSTSTASPSVKSVSAIAPVRPSASVYQSKGVPAVMYGEGSGKGKRPADEPHVQQQLPPKLRHQDQMNPQQIPQPVPAQVPYDPSSPPYVPQPAAQFVPQTTPQFIPQPTVPMNFVPGNVVPPTVGKQKRKGQKKVGKKAELQPIVGMFNDALGRFEPVVSVKDVLRVNKIDMTWMDMLAWSPAMCKELKRLCTRVTNKKTKKSGNTTAPPAQPIPFPQNFQPQFSFPQAGPSNQGQPSQAAVSQVNAGTSSSDYHTKMLRRMAGIDKAFCFEGVAKVNGQTFKLTKKNTQADQGSEMNVISPALVKQLSLTPRPLSEVGFLGLCMETADRRETLLEHWVSFDFGVEGLWRTVKCFISPAIPGTPDTPRLLLGMPWLHDVNAVIAIRGSSIQIGDPGAGEVVRSITGPELVYHRDHSLLMYPRAFIPHAEAFAKNTQTVEDDEDDDDEDSEESDSGDELSDIEEDKQDF